MSLSDALDKIYRNGSAWDRLEDGQSTIYWEENAIAGRVQVHKKLISWMRLQPGYRILDAGCGRGQFSVRMARRGAIVTAVDLYPRFSEALRKTLPKARVVQGDFRKIFVTRQPIFDGLVLSEVIEEYPPMERDRLFEWLCRIPFRKFYLTFKISSPAHSLLGRMMAGELSHTLDPVRVLRSIHLRTPFRLERKEEIRVRNYRAIVAAFQRPEEP